MTVLLILAITLGIRHAFEPDHVAAVLTVSSRSNSLSATAKQGAMWGVGHTITLSIISMMLIGWKIEIDKSVFVVFEFLVGVVLILMGIDVLRRAKMLVTEKARNKNKYKNIQLDGNTKLSLKTLGIGLLHGAAGSGVIIALVTTTIDSIYLKFTYIALFSIGLIISMSLLSLLMCIPIHHRIKLFPSRYFKLAAGSLAILIGMKILYHSSIQLNMLLI